MGRKIIVPKYLRNLHDILRTEKDDLSVKKTKQKQTKNSKMIFYLAQNTMLTGYEKFLVLKFLEMGNTVFFYPKC